MVVSEPGLLGVPWMNMAWTALFAFTGLVLMLMSVLVFDWITPYSIVSDVQKGNQAVGWVAAGLLVSTGIVMHAAMQANGGLLQAVLYSVLGILLNYAGYYLWEVVTRQWSLNKAIAENNVTAGIICFGLFIAIGLVVSGAFPPGAGLVPAP